jgi:hypothetical protein
MHGQIKVKFVFKHFIKMETLREFLSTKYNIETA